MSSTASLNDEEIRGLLLKYGQNVGPVVDSTREFYRRKLAKLMGEIKDEQISQGSDTEGSASENESNEETEELIQETLMRKTFSRPTQIRGRRSTNSYEHTSPVNSSYRSSSTFDQAELHHSTPPGQTLDKRRIITILCFVLGLALIIYLTFLNGISKERGLEAT